MKQVDRITDTSAYEKLASHLQTLPGGFARTASGAELRILRRLFAPDEAWVASNITLLPEPAKLNAATPLHIALGEFRQHMSRRDLAENTIKSFLYDLNFLGHFAGKNRPIGSIGTKDLNDFIEWLVHGRGVPCNPKSLARRITSLKVFFAWLSDSRAIPVDPAAPIIQRRPTSRVAGVSSAPARTSQSPRRGVPSQRCRSR